MTRVSFKFSLILPGHEGLLQLTQNLCGGEGQRSRQTANILGLLHWLPFYHFILESHVFCNNLPIKQIEYNLALSKYYGAWENTVRVLYTCSVIIFFINIFFSLCNSLFGILESLVPEDFLHEATVGEDRETHQLHIKTLSLYKHTLFERPFLLTGGVKMFRHLSLTCLW